MSAAVIDGSIDEVRQSAGFISVYCPDTYTYQRTIISNTVADFLRCWQRGGFDLIFIDTFLHNETSGIQIAEGVRRGDDFCTVVFTISSTGFALKGYEVRVLDYMMKLIRYERLCQTVEYFIPASRRKQSHYIEIKEGHIAPKIPIDSVFYTDYLNHYIQIHLPDKTTRTYMRFEEFSDMFLICSQSICCYRNCIINMDKVFSMEKSEFILTTEEHLPITRTMRSQTHQQYTDYQFPKLDGGI